MDNAERIYGRTGEIGRDGLLTPEQSEVLNRLQEKAAVASIDYLDRMTDDQEYPLVAMATGIGKGNIIHRVIEKQVRLKPDSKVLVIAGTKLTLVKQTHEALSGYQQQDQEDVFDYVESEQNDRLTNDTTSIENDPLEDQKSFLYKTSKLGQKDTNVHVATIQSVQSAIARRNLNPDDYDLVVVDEVHNIGTSKRKTTINRFKKAVGFTATPYRYSGSLKVPEQYGFTVIESLPLPEAQELRLLPPLLGIQIDTKDLVDEIPTTLTGSINFPALERLLKNSPDLRPFIADRISGIISDEDRRYKTVVAVNFVWEAQELAELLHEKGIKVGIAVNQQASKSLHTEEVPAIGSIERYKLPESDDKSIQVLISPYVASEGFDAPATEVLVWASPTDSSLRYTQYTGRLARRAEGKLFGVVVDCLYQTSQYNWSYNMGMWMKGDVRQLENGMLWLGPETSIESLKTLPQVEAIRKQADVKPISELQNEGLLEVQETDFPITQINFRQTFTGHYSRLLPISQQIIDEMLEKNPDIVAQRKNNSQVITVITDKELFINAMREKGVTIKDDFWGVNDTDFPITQDAMDSLFIGGISQRVYGIARVIVEEIVKDNPDLIRNKRGKQGRIIQVCVNKDLFIQKMRENGVRLRDQKIQEVQSEDVLVNRDFLRNTFKNGGRMMDMANEVISEIQSANPNFVVQARNRSHIVNMLRPQAKHLFIQRMQEKGAELQDKKLEPVQLTDFAVVQRNLRSFGGSSRKTQEIAEEILEELKKESPALVVNRIRIQSNTKGEGKGRIIRVVTDRERFIEEMAKRGIRLIPPK